MFYTLQYTKMVTQNYNSGIMEPRIFERYQGQIYGKKGVFIFKSTVQTVVFSQV